MKLTIEGILKGDADRAMGPFVPEFYRHKGHTLVVIGELRRIGVYDDEAAEGKDSVKVRWITLQPVTGEAAHHVRRAARAVYAAQTAQGTLLGDMSVDLDPKAVEHMGGLVGLEYYARLRTGVEHYLAQMGDLLATPAGQRSPERWHEEVTFLHKGLTAVVDAAEEPSMPDDLGPDVPPGQETLDLDGDQPAQEEGREVVYCTATLAVEPDGAAGFLVDCELPESLDTHPILLINDEREQWEERVHAGLGFDGASYSWHADYPPLPDEPADAPQEARSDG